MLGQAKARSRNPRGERHAPSRDPVVQAVEPGDVAEREDVGAVRSSRRSRALSAPTCGSKSRPDRLPGILVRLSLRIRWPALSCGFMPARSPRSIAELRDVAVAHLDKFTDRSGLFAFLTYDQADVHGGPITAADVLMANLLGLKLGWRDVVPLFADDDSPPARLRQALDAALDEARALPDLEACDEAQAEMPALRRANELARATAFPDKERRAWTEVTVSKVLHRLARNVPLVDSRVKRFYATRYAGEVRELMRADLVLNRGWLDDLTPAYPVRGEPMPLTRAADILIWVDGR
jgi:hypothetical protein